MTKVYSELERRLYVCVDSCVGREPVGRIYSPIAGQCAFGGILPMLNMMETVFDQTNCPQPTHEMRTFKPQPKRRKKRVDEEKWEEGMEMADKQMTEENLENKSIQMQGENGKQATFVITVKYRQNSTWQGKIQWMEEKREQTFRSTLEMIKLMDDALSSCQSEAEFDGWELI